MRNNVILKNLTLVDSSHPLNLKKVDILIKDSKISKISENIIDDSVENIIFNKEYVSLGWVDLHTHLYEDLTSLGVNADLVGVDSGVVCVCDAGSSGEDNIDDFYNKVKDKKTIVKSFINIASDGLVTLHELRDSNNINIDKTVNKIKEYKDFVVGIKVRASKSVMGDDTTTPFLKAKKVQSLTNVPIMVHFGNLPPTIEDVLGFLGKDDILTHCFHGKPNGVLNDGLIKKIVIDKRNEGLRYDVGHGQESFSYSVASCAMSNGFKPDSLSSDLHKLSLNGPVKSLANVVNKFLNLGYSLNEVIDMVTINPIKMIHIEDEISLNEGSVANLSIFKIDDESKVLNDSVGNDIKVDKVIKMVGYVAKGNYGVVKYEN